MIVVNTRALRTVVILFAVFMQSEVIAEEASVNRDWDYLAEVYPGGPDIDIETVDGTHQEIEFSDLVDVTKGGFMGGFYVQRDKWQFGVDGIYLEADDRINATLAEGIKLSEVELQVWYAAPTIAYQLAEFGRSEFYVYGGARFLWAEYTAKIKFS